MKRLFLILLALSAVSCSLTDNHWATLEDQDWGYESRKFYLKKAQESAALEYPEVDLAPFGDATLLRRSDWRRLTHEKQVKVRWDTIREDENFKRKRNPTHVEILSVSLNREGETVYHSYGVAQVWANWGRAEP